MLLKKLKQTCGFDQVVILFFYQNSTVCGKCDDQSFVLTDINKDIDDEVSILSFDTDLGIPTIKLLVEYYKIHNYPCTVIETQKYEGMFDKKYLMEKICENSPHVSVCNS